MSNDPDIDKRLESIFNRMRSVEPIDNKIVDEERSKFLVQGEIYRKAVSGRPQQHQIGWFETLILAFQKKERKYVLNFLVMVAVVMAVLFGGGGTVVMAAQDSLPGEPLYTVKTLSEDARLAITRSDQQQLELVLQYTDRRMDEIASLLTSLQPVPERTVIRLEQQLNAALQIAANMEMQQMVQALNQIRERVEVQAQTMTALNAASQPADAQLLHLEERLRQQSRLAAEGEADPQNFQLQMQNRQRQNSSQSPSAGDNSQNPGVTPSAPGNSYGPGPVYGDPTDLPGQFGPGQNGPNVSQTPTPELNSTAPGPAYGPTQTPYKPGLWWTVTPTITAKPNHKGSGAGAGENPGGSGNGGKK